MSFILKALKKVEEEKSARQVKPRDISSAILTAERTSGRTSRWPLTVGVILLLLIAGSGGAYFLLHQRSVPLSPTRNPVPGEASRTDQARPGLVTPPASFTPNGYPARKDASEHTEARPVSAAPVTAETKREVEASPPARGFRVAQPPPAERIGQESSGSSPSDVKVNGIALQDDPSASVAVVNGILVRRGMTIQGLRVEEIFHDKVRFSGNGETYDVQISR